MRLEVPLNDRPFENLPVVQVVLERAAWRELPEVSKAVVPEPSLKLYAASWSGAAESVLYWSDLAHQMKVALPGKSARGWSELAKE